MLLVFLTWNLPPVVGFGFLVYIDMLTFQQAITIISSPIETAFIFGSSAFALTYFYQYGKPLFNFEQKPSTTSIGLVLERMRRFPLHYWTTLLTYLVIAPSTVLISAEIYAGYIAQPLDWFRIHLVALIVSILVGLPLFFLSLDNFGRLVGGMRLQGPHLTIRTKVFMISTLTPLLIDTMLVQYYWSRTGHFSVETFWVWISLEVIAIVGAILFVRSFSQSIEPLNGMLRGAENFSSVSPEHLNAQSTDELGVLAWDFQVLLQQLHVQEEVINIRNRLLTKRLGQSSLEKLFEEIVEVADSNLDSDTTLIVVWDSRTDEMVVVCYTGHSYNASGYMRVSCQDASLTALVFREGKTIIIDDAKDDARINTGAVDRFQIRSAIAVPLQMHEQKFGVLVTSTNERLGLYQQRDVVVAEALAQEASLVINTINMHYQRSIAERDLGVVFETMLDTFFRTNNEGIIYRLSESVSELLGYSVDELIGTKIDKLFLDPEDAKKFIAIFQQSSGTVKNYQALLKRKDENVVWVETNARYYTDENGNRLGIEGIARNITIQKDTENALLEEKERAQVTLASIGDGVLTTDIDGKIDYVNPVLESMLGLKMKDVIGRYANDALVLLEEVSRSRIADPVDRCLSQQTVISSNMDTLLVGANGVEYAVELTVSPILDRLGHTIGVIMVLHDVTEMRRLSTQLSYQARHDSLTGLINRHEFEIRLDAALKDARDFGQEHALCYLDLDQFKIVNDTCGHMAGDELLRQLSGVLKKKIRKSDLLARLGGDEFGVLLSNCSIDTARNVAESLRETVRDFRFTWEGRSFDIGVSIGLVPINADSGSMADLLTAADNVCYMAKEYGRDRIQMYAADDDQVARRHGEARWATRINEAIGEGQFSLYGQQMVPLNGADDGRRHFEILIRLKEEGGRLVPPMAFIPAAERYYLMPKVDRWVVWKSFQTLAALKVSGEKDLVYSINLSGQSLSDDGFLDYVIRHFQEYRLEPGEICFEITETAAIANLSQAIGFISALKKHGCRFALDDFGSGLSSFSYLKNLDVDYLKIDGSFIRDMRTDPIDREMVEAINRVGRVMGLKTIAEYVEDEQTLQILSELGVDFVQGFAVARPVCIFDANPDEHVFESGNKG